jgi:O-antigen/teichoic acid export membrane protein
MSAWEGSPGHGTSSGSLLEAEVMDAQRDLADVLIPAPAFGIEQPTIAARGLIPSLRTNFGWTLAGNLFYGACQWGMLSVLAKSGSPATVGQFTLGLAVAAPVFTFTNLQLRSVQATDARSEGTFADYFTLRLLATGIGLVVICSLLLLVASAKEVGAVVLLVAIAKCIECMSDVTAGLLQKQEQLDRVGISLVLRGSASALVFAAIFAYLHSLLLAVAGMAGVWLAVFFLYDLPSARALLPGKDALFRFHPRTLGKLLMLSLPLGWVATLSSLNTNIPRYLLQHYLSSADLGIYAALAYLTAVINLVVLALGQSAITRLSRMFAAGEFRQFRWLLLKLSMFGVLITVAGVPLAFLFGQRLLTLLYGPAYGDHVGLLALFMGAAGLSTIGSFIFCGASAARSFRVQVPVYLAATLAGVGCGIVLVPKHGLMGAGIAFLLSVAVIAAGGVWIMHLVLKSGLKKRAALSQGR